LIGRGEATKLELFKELAASLAQHWDCTKFDERLLTEEPMIKVNPLGYNITYEY